MYKKSKYGIVALLVVIGVLLWWRSSGVSVDFAASKAKVPSHQTWDALLQQHVDDQGAVDYKGFLQDSTRLQTYLKTLSDHPPAEDWTRAERLAYWINAYNAFTVQLIVQHYPLKSIQELHPKPYIPMVNSVWHRKFFQIGGQPMTLNAIEHKILRVKFDEPRIHFAIVCASASCPQLLNRAYLPDQLDNQLDSQTRAFLADSKRNRIQADQLELSRIFSWFRGDFTKKGTLQAFINQYTDVEVDKNAKISFLKYDWSLNE